MKKYVCVSGTYYNLLLFFLINKEFLNTFYFLDPNLKKISEHNDYFYVSKNKFWKLINILRNYYKFKKIEKKYKLEDSIYFVQDHILPSYKFLDGKSYSLLEDGLTNYRDSDNFYNEYRKKSFFQKKMMKIFGIVPVLGVGERAKKIYLRGLLPIEKSIEKKVEIIDIKKLWKMKSEKEKEWINNYFEVSIKDIEILKNAEIILFTQPLSEDGYVTEEEKFKIYKEIVEKYKDRNVVIKIHPREKTNYYKISDKIKVINSKAPLELFELNGLNPKIVITLFSTAVYSFLNTDTEIIFLGTGVHKNLKERFGEENFGIERKDIYDDTEKYRGGYKD